MALLLNDGAYISLGKETTWGTAVARTIHRTLHSGFIHRVVEKPARGHMIGRTSKIVPQNHVRGIELVRGSFAVEQHYQGIGLLLEHILGTSGSSGAGPYDHTYTLQRGPGVGLTVEQCLGAAESGTGVREILEGWRCSRAEWLWEVGRVGLLTCEGIAQTAAARDASATPTLGNENPILPHYHGSTLVWNGRTLTIIRGSLVVDRQLVARHGWGTTGHTLQPAPGGQTSVRASFECWYEGDAETTIYNDYLADSVSDGVWSFSNPDADQAEYTMHNCYMENYSENTDGPGPRRVRFDLVAQSDATNSGLAIVITNDDSSAVAA